MYKFFLRNILLTREVQPQFLFEFLPPLQDGGTFAPYKPPKQQNFVAGNVRRSTPSRNGMTPRNPGTQRVPPLPSQT